MSFTFNPDHMAQDLTSLARFASDFLAPQSVQRLEKLARDLVNAVADSKSGAPSKFKWKTDERSPVQISPSRSWKGGTHDFDPVAADIRLEYTCKWLAGSHRVQAEGVCVFAIRDVTSDKEKIVHFDADVGGWKEMCDGNLVDRAGHPPFHAQFYGVVKDIPRLPSLIVHPIDVINFALLELHQSKWREHITSTEVRSQLRRVPGRQRERLQAILSAWTQNISDTSLFPLVAMQRSLSHPLLL